MGKSEPVAAEGLGDDFARAAAEAEALSAEMSGQVGAAGAAAEPELEAVEPTNAEVIAGMLLMAKGLPFVVKKLPRVAAEITEEIAAENGAAFGAFMDKYGWSFGGLDKWAVEIRAATVCGSFIYAVSKAAELDMRELRKAAEPEAPAVAEPAAPVETEPAAPAVSFG